MDRLEAQQRIATLSAELGGSLTLENRIDAQGCVARGILPR